MQKARLVIWRQAFLVRTIYISCLLVPQIRRTQKAIKTALTERWYAWEDARIVAEKDPEVDLNANLDTAAYKPTKDLFAVSLLNETLNGTLSCLTVWCKFSGSEE